MPIYEYKCQQCSHQFEKLVFKTGTTNKIECPECHGFNVARLFSAFGFSTGNVSRTSTGGSSACHSCTSHNCSSCGS